MNIHIQSINFTANKQLKEFINKKVDKLILIKDTIINTDVYLKVDKPEAYDNKIVEIKLHSAGGGFFARKQSRAKNYVVVQFGAVGVAFGPQWQPHFEEICVLETMGTQCCRKV